MALTKEQKAALAAEKKAIDDYIEYKKSWSKKWPDTCTRCSKMTNSGVSRRELHIVMIDYILGDSPIRGLRGCCGGIGLSKSALARYLDDYAFDIDPILAKKVFARMYFNKKQQYDVDTKIGLSAAKRRVLEDKRKSLKSMSDKTYIRTH